jgi:selenide,water dikinase
MGRNRDFFVSWVRFNDALAPVQRDLLFDPQTSGGLLMAVAADAADDLCRALVAAGDEAAIIGAVQAGSGMIAVR